MMIVRYVRTQMPSDVVARCISKTLSTQESRKTRAFSSSMITYLVLVFLWPIIRSMPILSTVGTQVSLAYFQAVKLTALESNWLVTPLNSREVQSETLSSPSAY